jgi:hypothetical protein
VTLSSVPSIEETGLDAALYGERQSFFTPRESLPSARRNSVGGGGSGLAKVAGGAGSRSSRMPEKAGESFFDAVDALHGKGRKKQDLNNKKVVPDGNSERSKQQLKRVDESGKLIVENNSRQTTTRIDEENVVGRLPSTEESSGGAPGSSSSVDDGAGKRNETSAEVWERLGVEKKNHARLNNESRRIPSTEEMRELEFLYPGRRLKENRQRDDDAMEGNSSRFRLKRDRLSGIDESIAEGTGDDNEELLVDRDSSLQSRESEDGYSEMLLGSPATSSLGEALAVTTSGGGDIAKKLNHSASSGAKERWRRLRHTVAFTQHVSHQVRHADDIFEGNSSEMLHRQNSLKVDAGGTGAAAFEGAKTVANSRTKGRKGMEGLMVRQDKCFVNMLQDFYVACLKVPMFFLH